MLTLAQGKMDGKELSRTRPAIGPDPPELWNIEMAAQNRVTTLTSEQHLNRMKNGAAFCSPVTSSLCRHRTFNLIPR
jgi:hypothetical protein